MISERFLWDSSTQSYQQNLRVTHPNPELVQLSNKNMKKIGIS